MKPTMMCNKVIQYMLTKAGNLNSAIKHTTFRLYSTSNKPKDDFRSEQHIAIIY